MAVKTTLPLDGPSAPTPEYQGKDRSDTVSAKPKSMKRNGTKTSHKRQAQPRDPSKLLEGFKTLYS
jgi:hypothetical protein